jgi:hypothetical protein
MGLVITYLPLDYARGLRYYWSRILRPSVFRSSCDRIRHLPSGSLVLVLQVDPAGDRFAFRDQIRFPDNTTRRTFSMDYRSCAQVQFFALRLAISKFYTSNLEVDA